MTVFTCSSCPGGRRNTLLAASDSFAIKKGWMLSTDGTSDTCPDCSRGRDTTAAKIEQLAGLVAGQAAEIAALQAKVDALCDKVGGNRLPEVLLDALTLTEAFGEYLGAHVVSPSADEITAYTNARAEIGAVYASPRKLPMGCGKGIEVWLPGGGRALRWCGCKNFGALSLCNVCQKLDSKGTP